jgi:hypothetical protein
MAEGGSMASTLPGRPVGVLMAASPAGRVRQGRRYSSVPRGRAAASDRA